MRTKNILTVLIIGLTAIFPLSCGDEYLWASQSDCNDCLSPKPTKSTLIIDLSNPAKRVPVRVYKGKYNTSMDYDNSQLIFQDTATISPYYVDVPVNEYYSVVAEYTRGSDKYKVVDGSEIRALSIKSTCNTDCWIIKGGTMDCRLKF
jgi:hypothetical protein